MLTFIKIALHQVIETLVEGGVKDVFCPRVFWNRRTISVEMVILTVNLPLARQVNNPSLSFFK